MFIPLRIHPRAFVRTCHGMTMSYMREVYQFRMYLSNRRKPLPLSQPDPSFSHAVGRKKEQGKPVNEIPIRLVG